MSFVNFSDKIGDPEWVKEYICKLRKNKTKKEIKIKKKNTGSKLDAACATVCAITDHVTNAWHDCAELSFSSCNVLSSVQIEQEGDDAGHQVDEGNDGRKQTFVAFALDQRSELLCSHYHSGEDYADCSTG